MSASGALVARSWARVVFGTLVAVGKPPTSCRAHRLDHGPRVPAAQVEPRGPACSGSRTTQMSWPCATC